MKHLAFILVALVVPGSAFAHSFGTFYETTSGPYTVDIGYSLPAPTEGESVTFEFELWDANREMADFSAAWVRIEDENGTTIFGSGLYNDPFGGPRMSYAFPKAGKYTVTARYDRDSKAIAEGSFPITVLPTTEVAAPGTPWYVYAIGAAAAAALVAGVLYVRRRRS